MNKYVQIFRYYFWDKASFLYQKQRIFEKYLEDVKKRKFQVINNDPIIILVNGSLFCYNKNKIIGKLFID